MYNISGNLVNKSKINNWEIKRNLNYEAKNY